MAVLPSIETFQWEDPLLASELLTDEERMIRDMAHDYAQSKLMPRILEANRNEIFDRAIFHEMGSARRSTVMAAPARVTSRTA